MGLESSDMPKHIDAFAAQNMTNDDNEHALFLYVMNPLTGVPFAVAYHFADEAECRAIALQLITPYEDLTEDMTQPPLIGD
jgi:hypothetical protein